MDSADIFKRGPNRIDGASDGKFLTKGAMGVCPYAQSLANTCPPRWRRRCAKHRSPAPNQGAASDFGMP